MRNLFAATLLLSPVLFTASAVASQPKEDAKSDVPVNTHVRPVSTGVIAPHILDASSIRLTPNDISRMALSEGKVVLALNIDESGKVQDVQVVQSLTPEADARIVDQVRKAHFRPATLDNQAVPLSMDLVVVVRR